MKEQTTRGTTNRLVCALAYWFWESHASWPARVTRVYGLKEYQTNRGSHVWVEKYSFWQTLWRATGMVFPACKKLWDRIEQRLWMRKVDKDEFRGGM